MTLSEPGVDPWVVPGGPALVTLTAMDLVELPEYRSLWLPMPRSDGGLPVGLPAGGFASPMGYWMYPFDDSAAALGAFSLTVRDKPGPDTPAAPAEPCRARRYVTLRPRDSDVGPLTLAIGGAIPTEVIASADAWSEYSEAVLLVTAQYYRLEAIERALDQVYAAYRTQESVSAVPSLLGWLRQGRVFRGADTFGETVHDWGHFTRTQVDPAHYVRSSRSIGAYRYLADGVGIPGWCQRMEEVIDEVDGGYDMLLDKLFHYKLFALAMAVEICILGLIGALLVHG